VLITAAMMLGVYTIVFMPLITLAMLEVPSEDAGLAFRLANVSQQIAVAVSIAVLGTVAASRTTALLAAGNSSAAALAAATALLS
jgi:hypothetical protein